MYTAVCLPGACSMSVRVSVGTSRVLVCCLLFFLGAAFCLRCGFMDLPCNFSFTVIFGLDCSAGEAASCSLPVLGTVSPSAAGLPAFDGQHDVNIARYVTLCCCRRP